MTFFEYPGARRGRAGAGMVHTVTWRVASEAALDFWEERLRGSQVQTDRSPSRLTFHDPEGLRLELAAVETEDEPLTADHPDIPRELALQGFDSVQAYSASPDASRHLLEDGLGFEPHYASSWEVRGDRRGSTYSYDPPPAEPGIGGAGTVHHVAWASQMDDHEAWRERALGAGAQPTPVIDRFYFKSIYFREPSGVLFEIATIGPGFATDEPLEHLGERLSLPPDYEHLRDRLEPVLTPLPDPRAVRAG
jgi:glyoxalase family protein